MRSRLAKVVAAVALVATLSTSVRAQDYVVYDPWTWYENVLQVFTEVRELTALLFQLARLPVDMVNRYRTITRAWPVYTAGGLRFAAPLVTALNNGDALGTAYRDLVRPLDVPDDVLSRMPAGLRQRLQAGYGAVELADRVAAMAIDQAGHTRQTSATLLTVIQAMQNDSASTVDDFHSQTALLNKINAASVLGLRIGERTNEFLGQALEQLTVDSTRRRQTEAALLNATITQWRYGQTYGASLFEHTATNLDTWRLR
jgi:hypothetical protein